MARWTRTIFLLAAALAGAGCASPRPPEAAASSAPAVPAPAARTTASSPGLAASWDLARRAAREVLRAPAPLSLFGQRAGGEDLVWTWTVLGAGGQVAEVVVDGREARVASVERRTWIRAPDLLDLRAVRVEPGEALAKAGGRRVEHAGLAATPAGGARWSLTLEGGARIELDAQAEAR